MLIQVQYSKSILLEIYSEQEPRQCFSLLIEKNKQTKKPTEEAKGTILDFSQETIEYCECCHTTYLLRVPQNVVVLI